MVILAEAKVLKIHEIIAASTFWLRVAGYLVFPIGALSALSFELFTFGESFDLVLDYLLVKELIGRNLRLEFFGPASPAEHGNEFSLFFSSEI